MPDKHPNNASDAQTHRGDDLADQESRAHPSRDLGQQRGRALETITTLASSSLELADVASRALASASDYLKVSATSLWLLDERSGLLSPYDAVGFPPEFFEDFAQGLQPDAPHDVARVLATREPAVYSDASHAEIPKPVADAYRRYRIPLGALIVLPLANSFRNIGALTLAWSNPRQFSAADLEFDELLASALSSALENARLFAEARESREQMQTIIESMPIGVSLIGPAGQMLQYNQAYLDVWCTKALPELARAEDFRRMRAFDLETGEPLPVDRYPGARVLQTGEPIVDELTATEHFDGKRAMHMVSVTPVLDDDGTVSSMVVVTRDVTSELKRERLERALTEIGITATSTFDSDEILRRVLKQGAEALGAGQALVTLLDDRGWLVAETTDPAWGISGGRFRYEQLAGARRAVEERAPVWIADTAAAEGLDQEVVSRIGGKAFIALPLITQGRPLGTLIFVYPDGPHPFSEPELTFATRLQSVVTLALENASVYAREHLIAETLQEAVLTKPQAVKGLEVTTAYRAASTASAVGGDFYDLFEIDRTHIGVLVGDVSGKGLDAARFTTLLRDGARAYALVDPSPDRTITRLNHLVYKSSPPDYFATAFYGVLNVRTGKLIYCGAGHPPALLLGADGGTRWLESRSPIVGAIDDVVFHADVAELNEGDTLILYTDGLVEARRNGELFGTEGLEAAVRGHAQAGLSGLPAAMLDAVLAYTGGELRDDSAILCVRRVAPSA